jgi:glycerol-3-phosphate acyltransferase PlsX
LRIGIDLMGSDTPPQFLYEAVLRAAEHFDASCTLIALATQSIVDELTHHLNPTLTSPDFARIEFHIVPEVILMGDEPLMAIRRKSRSSLSTGIRLLKKRLIDAFVTAGNTGALIASITLSLPLLPGIKRPALLAVLPSETNPIAIVDVGGNVSSKSHYLIQFASMGAAYQRCCLGIAAPRIGLLNVGVESKKGTKELREAYQFLEENGRSLNINFVGNIEAREVFQGKADVLVTDGFTGNILLKSIEGASTFILEYMAKSGGSHMHSIVNDLQKRFHYAEYPGAIVCGADGIIVKCHGNATPTALFNSIKGAVRLVKLKLVQQIKQQLLV